MSPFSHGSTLVGSQAAFHEDHASPALRGSQPGAAGRNLGQGLTAHGALLGLIGMSSWPPAQGDYVESGFHIAGEGGCPARPASASPVVNQLFRPESTYEHHETSEPPCMRKPGADTS